MSTRSPKPWSYPKTRWTSVPCQWNDHGKCDGLVHWHPVRKDGQWMGDVPEMERPKDLLPNTCPCRCHLNPGVSGEGDST